MVRRDCQSPSPASFSSTIFWKTWLGHTIEGGAARRGVQSGLHIPGGKGGQWVVRWKMKRKWVAVQCAVGATNQPQRIRHSQEGLWSTSLVRSKILVPPTVDRTSGKVRDIHLPHLGALDARRMTGRDLCPSATAAPAPGKQNKMGANSMPQRPMLPQRLEETGNPQAFAHVRPRFPVWICQCYCPGEYDPEPTKGAKGPNHRLPSSIMRPLNLLPQARSHGEPLGFSPGFTPLHWRWAYQKGSHPLHRHTLSNHSFLL